VPERFLAAGRAAFAWHTVDADLAALTFDSELATDTGVRSEPAALRSLTFDATQVSLEIEVHPGELIGQIAPPQPGAITLRLRDGSVRDMSVDDVGWFRITPRPRGLFQLHLRTDSGLSVLTEWMTL
jgi:hypothetical protein